MTAARPAMAGGVLALRAGRQRAGVLARGATLRSWSVDGTERLSWFPPGDPRHAFDGATLVPWPNRIRDGRYTAGGRTHQLPVTEPERDNALHGLATDVEWAVVAVADDLVRLRRRIGPAPGYPYTVDVQVAYRLAPDGVRSELVAVNRGRTPAPFGAGAHPYLALPAGVDAAALELPGPTFLPTDERRLPAGDFQPVDGTPLDFRTRRPLAGVTLDTCFALSHRAGSVGRVRVWPGRDAPPVTVWLDRRVRYVHVYTGDDGADPRARIAIEPLTCAPDAFNSGHGLVTLLPGRRLRLCWGLTVGDRG